MPVGICVILIAEEFVNVLPARSAGTVCINPQIVRIYNNFIIVFNFRHNVKRCKEVWPLEEASNGEILTSLCTPFFALAITVSFSPSISKVTLLNTCFIPSGNQAFPVLYPLLSAHFVYIRKASAPSPAPQFRLRRRAKLKIALFLSYFPVSKVSKIALFKSLPTEHTRP